MTHDRFNSTVKFEFVTPLEGVLELDAASRLDLIQSSEAILRLGIMQFDQRMSELLIHPIFAATPRASSRSASA